MVVESAENRTVEQLAGQVATRIEPVRAQGRSASGTTAEIAEDLATLERL